MTIADIIFWFILCALLIIRSYLLLLQKKKIIFLALLSVFWFQISHVIHTRACSNFTLAPSFSFCFSSPAWFNFSGCSVCIKARYEINELFFFFLINTTVNLQEVSTHRTLTFWCYNRIEIAKWDTRWLTEKFNKHQYIQTKWDKEKYRETEIHTCGEIEIERVRARKKFLLLALSAGHEPNAQFSVVENVAHIYTIEVNSFTFSSPPLSQKTQHKIHHAWLLYWYKYNVALEFFLWCLFWVCVSHISNAFYHKRWKCKHTLTYQTNNSDKWLICLLPNVIYYEDWHCEVLFIWLEFRLNCKICTRGKKNLSFKKCSNAQIRLQWFYRFRRCCKIFFFLSLFGIDFSDNV